MNIQTITFGTYRLGGEILTNALHNAFITGYRAIDTASLYNNQVVIGNFLSQNQINHNEIFITSKLPTKIIQKTEDEIINNITNTMTELKINYIDLFLLHGPVKGHNIKAWDIIERFHYQGYIHNIGISNYDINDIEEIKNFSTTPIFTNQIEISPFLIRNKIINYLKSSHIRISAHSSLAKGEKLNDPSLLLVANKYNKSPAQIMLKWALQNNFYIIPRSFNPLHIKENFILDFNIENIDIEFLNNLNCGYTTHPQYKFI